MNNKLFSLTIWKSTIEIPMDSNPLLSFGIFGSTITTPTPLLIVFQTEKGMHHCFLWKHFKCGWDGGGMHPNSNPNRNVSRKCFFWGYLEWVRASILWCEISFLRIRFLYDFICFFILILSENTIIFLLQPVIENHGAIEPWTNDTIIIIIHGHHSFIHLGSKCTRAEDVWMRHGWMEFSGRTITECSSEVCWRVGKCWYWIKIWGIWNELNLQGTKTWHQQNTIPYP